MADAITPAVEEMEKSLKNVDKVLTSSAKESFMLKKELIGINKVISTKNWEILSRFLSGTGAWRVLNKFKASILAMVQLASIQERAALSEAQNMKRIAEVAKERQDLIKMETALRKAQTSADDAAIDKLREMSDLFAGTELIHGQQKALDMLAERTKKQVAVMTGIVQTIGGKGSLKGKTLTEDPMNKNILDSNIIQTAAIAGGFLMNRKFLKNIAQNSGVTKKVLDERLSMVESLEADFQDVWNNMPQQTIDGKDRNYEAELIKFMNENSDIHHTTAKPTQESIAAEIGMVADNVGKFSLSPSELLNRGMEYVEKIIDLNQERYDRELEQYNNYTDRLNDTFKVSQDIYDQHLTHLLPDSPFNKDNNLSRRERTLKQFKDERKERGEERGNRMKDALGIGKGKQRMEDLKKRLQAYTMIYKRPLLNIRKHIQKNGGILKAIEDSGEEGMTRLVVFVSKIVSFMKKLMLGAFVILTTLFLLYRAFQSSGFREAIEDAWAAMETVFNDIIYPALELIWEGIGSIVEGFQEGNYMKVVVGALKILQGALTVVLGIGWALIVGAVNLLYDGTIYWLQEVKSAILKEKDTIGKTLLAGGLTLLGAAATITRLGGLFTPWGLAGAIATGLGAYLVGLADGGVTTGGLNVVGEKGAELVKLPAGSRVYSNADSQKMLSAGGSNTTNITVQVQGRIGASDAEVRDMVAKVAREVNLRMNRTSAAVTKFG